MAAEELHQLDDQLGAVLKARRLEQRLFRGDIERGDLRDAVDERFVIQSADCYVDPNGVMYLTDTNAGLNILQFDGA